MTDVASRELTCKHGRTVRRASMSRARSLVQRPFWALRDPLRAVLGAKRPVASRLGRSKTRSEAVWGARRPVRRPSWALRGPSGGRLERQATRPEAVLGARRAIRRLSWTPGGPSAGRLGRQDAKMQVLLQFCCKMQVLRRRRHGGPNSKVPKAPTRLSVFFI